MNLSGHPDFGYGNQNYIFDDSDPKDSRWLPLTHLLKDGNRFEWLMNYIQLGSLNKQIKCVQET